MRGKMYPYDDQPEYQTRTAAAYKADGMTDGVIVPVLKSLFLGFTTGVLVGLLAWAFNATFSPWLAFAVAWFVVMPFSFWRYSERAMWMIERIAGADLNGDSFVGQPTQQQAPALTAPIRVEVSRDEGRAVDFIDLPVKPEKLPQLARGLLAGRSFNQTAWTGSAGIFSRSEFDALRDTMIQRGLLAWRNPESKAQGCDLTAAGRAVMRRLANLSPTLPPTQ